MVVDSALQKALLSMILLLRHARAELTAERSDVHECLVQKIERSAALTNMQRSYITCAQGQQHTAGKAST